MPYEFLSTDIILTLHFVHGFVAISLIFLYIIFAVLFLVNYIVLFCAMSLMYVSRGPPWPFCISLIIIIVTLYVKKNWATCHH